MPGGQKNTELGKAEQSRASHNPVTEQQNRTVQCSSCLKFRVIRSYKFKQITSGAPLDDDDSGKDSIIASFKSRSCICFFIFSPQSGSLDDTSVVFERVCDSWVDFCLDFLEAL